MHRYPWIDLRALGALAVAADAARAGACRFVVAEAERDTRARRGAQLSVSTPGVATLVDDVHAPLAGVRVRIDGAADFDAVRTAIARHALVLIDYALATTVPLERLLASVREAACRIVVSLADPHGAAYLARKHAHRRSTSRSPARRRRVAWRAGRMRRAARTRAAEAEDIRGAARRAARHRAACGDRRLFAAGRRRVRAGRRERDQHAARRRGRRRAPAGRPLTFGIDAGSAESFVFCGGDRARQLSLLRSGERILTVGAAGDTRASDRPRSSHCTRAARPARTRVS